jgi:hypothetical protein
MSMENMQRPTEETGERCFLPISVKNKTIISLNYFYDIKNREDSGYNSTEYVQLVRWDMSYDLGAALTSVEKNSRPQLMSQRTSCT